MRIAQYAAFAMIFVLIGEAVVRFDQSTAFFRSGERLDNSAKDSSELREIEDGRFQPEADELRVLVLGDSFLYGAGVPPAETFGERLKTRLRARNLAPYRSVRVLDATRPGANTYANRLFFETYRARFQPQLVILAYNPNDAYGDQGPGDHGNNAAEDPSPSAPPAPQQTADLDFVRSVRRTLFRSQLLQFVLVKLNMELKLGGVVIPGTEFDHLVNQSHASSHAGWQQSQQHLRSMAEACRASGSRLIVTTMPELNMLARHDTFQPMNAAMAEFFRGIGVEYLDGWTPFVSREASDYSISRYDGHPNAAAHQILADTVYDYLLQTQSSPDAAVACGRERSSPCP